MSHVTESSTQIKIKLSPPLRWHAWCGEEITAESTTLRVAVVNDRWWFVTNKKTEFVGDKLVQEEDLYDLPSTWGTKIDMKSLPVGETLLVEMMPDDHAWKNNRHHTRRISRLREFYRRNEKVMGPFPVRMSELS